jgi:hypothetical protein
MLCSSAGTRQLAGRVGCWVSWLPAAMCLADSIPPPGHTPHCLVQNELSGNLVPGSTSAPRLRDPRGIRNDYGRLAYHLAMRKGFPHLGEWLDPSVPVRWGGGPGAAGRAGAAGCTTGAEAARRVSSAACGCHGSPLSCAGGSLAIPPSLCMVAGRLHPVSKHASPERLSLAALSPLCCPPAPPPSAPPAGSCSLVRSWTPPPCTAHPAWPPWLPAPCMPPSRPTWPPSRQHAPPQGRGAWWWWQAAQPQRVGRAPATAWWCSPPHCRGPPATMQRCQR